GVIELLALEIDLCAANAAGGRRHFSKMLGEPFGKIKRRGPADIIAQMAVHLGLERRIGLGRVVGLLQLEDQRHQGFGDEAAAENAEMPVLVGTAAEGIGTRLVHRTLNSSLARAARMKSRIMSRCL